MPVSAGETGKYESYWVADAEMAGQSWCMVLARLEWLDVETGERSSLSGVERASNAEGGVPSPVPPLSRRSTVSETERWAEGGEEGVREYVLH